MDTSHSLATDSFSYSWLATELEPKIASNKLFPDDDQEEAAQYNFDFDISMSKSSSSSLVHADKLFSNGLIMPQSFDNVDDEPSRPTTRDYYSDHASISSQSPSPWIHHNNNAQIVDPKAAFRFQRTIFLRKLWCKFPRRVISKYIRCLIPAGVNRRSSRGVISSTRVDDVNRRAWEVNKSWSHNNVINTPDDDQAVSSPRKNSSIAAWSDTDESPIHEAILYCKRSSGVCS